MFSGEGMPKKTAVTDGVNVGTHGKHDLRVHHMRYQTLAHRRDQTVLPHQNALLGLPN